ncbi:MAG TPA: ABC transporter permease [Actinomycetota bacterium]
MATLAEPASPPITPRSPKAVARERRKISRHRFWSIYRKSVMGMAGLAILIVFVLMALLAPLLVSSTGLDVTKVSGPALSPPSWAYPLGTDNQGRSVLTLIIWGSRISLLIGLLAATVSMVVGSVLGILAGYRGGMIDTALMRLTDWFLVLPWVALMIVLAAILGQSLTIIVLVIGLTSWAWTARLVRSQTLSVRERPFVERVKGLGSSDSRIMIRHVLPNVLPVIIAQTILSVALAILAESTLSFIGLGDPLRVSWGQTLEQAFDTGAVTLGAWWWIGAPGVCIVLLVLAFTMCSTALEEIFNPRLRQR